MNIKFLHIVLLLLGINTNIVFTQTTIVDYGSSWSYYDNENEPADQGSLDWNDISYDASSWSSGNAQLGYGDGDEATTLNNNTLTVYVRHSFNITNPADFETLNLNLTYDDGAIVYLNGVEVWRVNMPGGSVSYGTFASSTSSDNANASTVIASSLVSGTNVLAVEVHQRSTTSSDISFDFRLSGNAPGQVTIIRGPYLQKGTPSSIVLRWRTATATESVVDYGTSLGNLNQNVSDLALKTEHEIEITGLLADTKYFYQISNATSVLVAEANDVFFKTHPTTGTSQAYTFWALGDCGTANNNQRAVRDAYYSYIGDNATDGILFLGDNAYNDGTDSEYQTAVFENMYEDILKNSVAWSTLGNHDGYSADSNSQTGPYYDIFSFPTAGESGGMASGTEAYYSFDYGNVHFIVLDSYETNRSVGGTMYNWAQSDIQNTTQDWIIALWHHPPYTKGSHDSDTESNLIQMRENFLPMLESNGVDLVLSGHSHSYERSYFLNGHYGDSNTFNSVSNTVGANGNGDGRTDGNGAYVKAPTSQEGAVYITAGSSGKVSGGSLDHEAMYYSVSQLGSCIIEVDGNNLTVKFIRETGAIEDYFTIQKGTCTIGASCDDGDPCTVNDVYDSDCNCAGTLSQRTSSGDIETYVGNIIDNAPGSTGDNYVVPNASELTTWNTVIDLILADNLTDARSSACSINYTVTEFTDTTLSPNQVFYVLEEKNPQQNYWGTYVFSKTPERGNLVLMAPHSKFDTNTGKEAVHCFKNNVARAVFINGTHRCNNSIYSTCSGTTSVCGSSEAYRVSDLAHNTNSIFQQTTDNLFNNISNSVFIQLHGFAKQASDPYVIMSNGTRITPSPDYATQIKDALLVEDNTLTFELAHINTSWTRLIGFTNTQGRLINNSPDHCNTSATATTGRFIHIEQEKSKLRDDVTGWAKMSNALSNVFPANCVADSDGDGVCDADDICPGFDDNIDSDGDSIPDGCDPCDDNLIGTSCDDGDDCTINDVYDENCDCVGTFEDSDGDGVCDVDDLCPGEDDTIDNNNNGIPDACESGCIGYTIDFIDNPLTHSGTGANSTTLSFPADSKDILFTISGINQKTNGKPSNKYIEQVEVTYTNGFGVDQTYGIFSGVDVSSVNIDISGKVQSVTVSLSDIYSGSTNGNMSVNFNTVSYCIENTPCIPDSDGDGVCDTEDQCPGLDDALIGTGCDDGDNCTLGETYDNNCNCSGGIYTDNDGDGLCVGDDPDDDDPCVPNTGAPGCNNCQSSSGSFPIDPLTHSGNGSSSTTLVLPANSQDLSFTISGLDQLTGGKKSNRYIERVIITYVDGNGSNQNYGTFNAGSGNSVNISILTPEIVQSVTVSLEDAYDGNSSTVLSVDLGLVSFCINNSSQQAKSAFKTSKINEDYNSSKQVIEVYPNPVSNDLYIESRSLESSLKASLFNVRGQLVIEKVLSKEIRLHSIEVRGLSEGLYILRMTDKEGVVLKTQRIVIKR